MKTRLANGDVAVYRYHRISRARLRHEPGTAEFDEEMAALNAAAKVRPAETVYFVQARQLGLIKIGIANDVPRRLTAMRTAWPDHLDVLGIIRRGGIGLERELHALFAAHRAHGEWFRPSPFLLDYIAKNATPGRP